MNTKDMRHSLDHSLDALEMLAFNQGFEACLDGLDDISNQLHNSGDTMAAEIIRWAVKEMKGENIAEDDR